MCGLINRFIGFMAAIFILSCHQSKNILQSEGNKSLAYITMDNTQVLYRGFDSLFEYDAQCIEGSHTYLKIEGGTLRKINSEKMNTAMLKADSTAEEVTLKLYCVNNIDSVLLVKKTYPVKNIPNPNIYYGGINLTDYSIYNDTVLFNSTGIQADYRHVPGLNHVSAAIYDCSYTFRDREYHLNGVLKSFHASILNEINPGERIYFNTVKFYDVSGKSTTLYIKRELIKASAIESNLFILR